jgi:transcriptional regulator with XRE-family HTH domain
VGASRELPVHYARYFRALGHRIRSYRTERKLTQEDMISRMASAFATDKMIEAGRPTTNFTLLRIAEALKLHQSNSVAGWPTIFASARRIDLRIAFRGFHGVI